MIKTTNEIKWFKKEALQEIDRAITQAENLTRMLRELQIAVSTSDFDKTEKLCSEIDSEIGIDNAITSAVVKSDIWKNEAVAD